MLARGAGDPSWRTELGESSERPHVPSVLDALPQVLLVTGKGGVGKSTVAAGLASAAAARGERALLCSTEPPAKENRRFEVRTLDVDSAFETAATELFGSRTLAKAVLGGNAVRRLLDAAHAVRAFALLEQVRRWAEDAPDARLVVELPASGHGLAWLRATDQLRRFTRAGAAHRFTRRLEEELLRPERSAVVVVGLPEPLVWLETAALLDALRASDAPAGALVVNRVPSRLVGLDDVADETLPAPLAAARTARRASRAIADRAAHHAAPAPVRFLPRAPHDPDPELVARWLLEGDAAFGTPPPVTPPLAPPLVTPPLATPLVTPTSPSSTPSLVKEEAA